jgi:hypothetical protein
MNKVTPRSPGGSDAAAGDGVNDTITAAAINRSGDRAEHVDDTSFIPSAMDGFSRKFRPPVMGITENGVPC